MTPEDFDYLRKLLRERSGLVLSAEKQYLAESRLLPVARKNGLAGVAELVAKLKAGNTAPISIDVVEAMTTNESYFFRDKMPFEHFNTTVMPALLTVLDPLLRHPALGGGMALGGAFWMKRR